MKFRVQLDDDLIRTAQDYTGESDLSLLVTRALDALILFKSPAVSTPAKPSRRKSSRRPNRPR